MTQCKVCPEGRFAASGAADCTTCVARDRDDFDGWTTWSLPDGADKVVVSLGATSRDDCNCKLGLVLTASVTCEAHEDEDDEEDESSSA